MSNKQNEVTWRIVPTATPLLIRHCSKCNKKMEFYCSEKFRINGNHTRVDIWLIYKCSKCDTTWKLTIKKGIKPHDISAELFDKFTNNDVGLAWKYAFDRQFLKQHACIAEYGNITYDIDGFSPPDLNNQLIIHLESMYTFDLKLSAFLARALNISVSKLKKYAESGQITAISECSVMKYKIRANISILIQVNQSKCITSPPTTTDNTESDCILNAHNEVA